jgi:hypothetical protein
MPVITAGRFAAATSVLALAVAMGGTGYAAVKIGSHQIKNNAITSKKIKDNSVSGADVDESTLGKVPSATSADSATTATTASGVNGVTPAKVFYRSGPAGPTVIFSGSGLTISASCTANDISLTASTSKQNSSIYSSFEDIATNTILGNNDQTQAFDVGDVYDLLLGDTVTTQDPAILRFAYDTLDGSIVVGQLATDNSDGGPDVCSVTGAVDAA